MALAAKQKQQEKVADAVENRKSVAQKRPPPAIKTDTDSEEEEDTKRYLKAPVGMDDSSATLASNKPSQTGIAKKGASTSAAPENADGCCVTFWVS